MLHPRGCVSGVVLPLLAFAAGCGTGEGSHAAERGDVARRDSAGIDIVETPGTLARAPLGWTVGAEPDLQLGSATTPGPEQFHLIGGLAGGIAALPDGRILIVDRGSGELRFFDWEGRFLASAGGLGDGPGEFRQPRLVRYTSSDSLVIYDLGHRRFSVVSPDGRYLGTITPGPPDQTPTGTTPRGASPDGILMTGNLGTFALDEGPITTASGARWLSLHEERVDTLLRIEGRAFGTREIIPPVPFVMSAPFSPAISAAFGRQGFVLTTGGPPEIHGYDTSGRLVRMFRVDEPRRPVTPDDLEAAAERMVDQDAPALSEQVRRVFDQLEPEPYWPSFEDLLLDDLGWTWAKLWADGAPSATTWMVFDSEGVARGTIELPPGLEVHQIGADFVLGRWRNDLGVEHVRRHALERAP